MSKATIKPVNRSVYTPPSERRRTETGRTLAGDRRKARALGFKSVNHLNEHIKVSGELGDLSVLTLISAFIHKGKPHTSPARHVQRRIKKAVGSPRQYVRAVRESYVFKELDRRWTQEEVGAGFAVGT